MTIELLNPDGLPKPDMYRQVATATGTIYVVDWSPDKMEAFSTGVMRVAADLGIDPTKAATLLSVAGLGEPDLLVEIEAIAVLD